MEKYSSRIISNILESISKSEILIADISGLNPNVLFSRLRIWNGEKNNIVFPEFSKSKKMIWQT